MADRRLSKIVDGKKRCTLCTEWKLLTAFGKWIDKDRNGKRYDYPYYTARCKPCMSIASRRSALKNQAHIKERNRLWMNNLREKVYAHYGNKCVCCGESNPMFFTIDHVNNDGYLIRERNKPGGHRKLIISGQWYKHIIESGFPIDLQLMCYNCNCGKQRNKGVCPHANSA